MKKYVVIAVVIVIILTLMLFFALSKNDQVENAENTIQNTIRISEFNIENRVALKIQSDIYVGNNLKELENNFYDIKIQNVQDGVIVRLNKLWYEDYGDDYIQDDYLAKICRELSSRLNVQDSEQFEYVLYKYIKDNYMKVRQDEKTEEIITDVLGLKLELEDDIVKLIIRGN